VGYSTSFLDAEETRKRGEKIPPWQFITRVLTNPLSIENKIFSENLQPVLFEVERHREEQKKREMRAKKKIRGNIDFIMTN
jgi:hypothetical protein